jgi:hypothetical protein
MSIPLELFGSVGPPDISIGCPLPESVFYVTLDGDFMAVDVKSEKCGARLDPLARQKRCFEFLSAPMSAPLCIASPKRQQVHSLRAG